MEVVGELGAGEGVLVGSVERRARKRRVVLGELKPTRVQQEPDHVGGGVGLAGQLIHHPGIVEGAVDLELPRPPPSGVDDVRRDQPSAGRQQGTDVRQHGVGAADVVERVHGQDDVERSVFGRHVQDTPSLIVDVGPCSFSPRYVQHPICDVNRQHVLGVVGQQHAVPPCSTAEVDRQAGPLGQVTTDPVVEAAADAVPDAGEAVEQLGEIVEIGVRLFRRPPRCRGDAGSRCVCHGKFPSESPIFLGAQAPGSLSEASRYSLVASVSGVASPGTDFFCAP